MTTSEPRLFTPDEVIEIVQRRLERVRRQHERQIAQLEANVARLQRPSLLTRLRRTLAKGGMR